jgi:SNF2 family DNA or RNA helicase
MSRDFERERKLKLNNAKKISKSIRVHHLHKKSSKREDTIDYEKIKKKIAQQVSRMVSHYWKSVEKLAVHLQKLQIEKKRHEERSKRLDKLVDKQLELSHRVAEDLQRKKAPIYINLVKRNNLWKVSEEEDEADYAAKVASDFQPKGFTLDTTSVVTKIPFMLKGKLREYQHIGLDWLTTLHDKKLNGILADEMGLGKTIQTISMLAYLACERGIWGPHLIVVPTSIMMNWEMELKRWCPGLKVLTYFGNQKERKQKRIGWSKPNSFHVCITSYKLVVQDHFAFKRKQWYYLILDEAQHIKNFQSKRWQILLRFNSRRKLLLTGTPLQNDVIELWSLLHFLMPNLFASHDDFQAWFSSPFNSAMATDSDFNATVVNRLQSILRPFLLRRLKKDVEKQLPVKTEHVIFCPLSRRQQFLYDEFLERRGNQDGDTIGIMNILMQLRKVCNHPDLFSPRDVYSPFRMTDLKYLIPPILLLHFIKQEFILTYFSLLSNEQYSKIESSRLQSLKSPMTLLQAYKMYNDTTQMKHEYFNLSGQSVLKPRDSSILNMLPYLTPDDFPIPLKRTFVSPACLPFLTTQTYPIITISEKQHKLRSEFLSSFQSINDLRIYNSYPVYGIRLRNMLTFNSSKLENMVDITHFSCNNECCSNKAEDMEIDIEEPIKKYRKDSSYFQEVYREDIFRELFSCQDIWINVWYI